LKFFCFLLKFFPPFFFLLGGLHCLFLQDKYFNCVFSGLLSWLIAWLFWWQFVGRCFAEGQCWCCGMPSWSSGSSFCSSFILFGCLVAYVFLVGSNPPTIAILYTVAYTAFSCKKLK
jgi:hypothetical protein